MAATVDEVTAGSMVVAAVVVAQGLNSVAVPAGTAAVLASGSVATAAIAQYHQSCPSEFDCPRNNRK